MTKIAIIRKVKGKYILYSRKKDPKTGRRRRLGESDTLAGIKKRERQVQFFKQYADDQNALDHDTEALTRMSDVAQYLEQAGYVEHAQTLYDTMAALDSTLDSEPQYNTENQGALPMTNSFSIPGALAFVQYLAKTASELDEEGLTEEADELDALLQELVREYEAEQNNVDMAVNSNGLQGTSTIDNQGSGMFSGLSDSYFYSGYQNQEGAYGRRNDPDYTRPELERKLAL